MTKSKPCQEVLFIHDMLQANNKVQQNYANTTSNTTKSTTRRRKHNILVHTHRQQHTKTIIITKQRKHNTQYNIHNKKKIQQQNP